MEQYATYIQEGSTGLPEVEQIFREHSKEILQGMTDVLREYGIEGYSVHTAMISSPPSSNPDICIPYLRGIPGDGVEIGCTYVKI